MLKGRPAKLPNTDCMSEAHCRPQDLFRLSGAKRLMAQFAMNGIRIIVMPTFRTGQVVVL
jgi:hypothetical protein